MELYPNLYNIKEIQNFSEHYFDDMVKAVADIDKKY